MKIDYLVFPTVSDDDYKRAMIFLDIIVDEAWDTLVQLLPHTRERTKLEKGGVRA